MREGFRGMIGGLLAASSIAAGSGEAMAQPPTERVEHRAEERKEKDLAWTEDAQAEFAAANATGDTEAMADVIRAFIREYHFPTRGTLTYSHQDNVMRILDQGEWRQLRGITVYFLANASAWGAEYPALQRKLSAVVESIDVHINLPGPVRGHKIPAGEHGDIDRSLGYR